MKPSTLLWCATAMAACANVTSPSPIEAQRLTEARSLLRENPDGALRITDELLAGNPHLREARLLAAQGSRALAQQGGGVRPDLLLQDAARNLEKVVQDTSQPIEPETWRLLAECYFDLGEFGLAGKDALLAAEGFVATKRVDSRRQAAESVLLAANAELRQFVAARKQEIDGGEANPLGVVPPSSDVAKLATTTAAHFEDVRREFPAEAATQIALVHQWLGQDQAAAEELERGIRNHPDLQAIHEAYLTWMISRGQNEALAGAYSRFVRESPGTVILRWYQGRALYARGDALRRQGNFQGANAGYAKAQSVFAEYGAMMPAHSDSTNQWIALCEMAIARTCVELGDFLGARAHLFAADDASPLATTYDDSLPRLTDSFGSHYTGVVFAIHRALADSGESALRRTLAFNEAVLNRHPDRWGFVYNNAALAARDLGVQIETGGQQEAANELWERSYRYYEKASALSPDDARIRNDTGLMLIYHLNRDFERARECFDRAIAVGQEQLDAMPADTDARERELLEEAVGDAWQNIGRMLQLHQKKPFEEYREFCEKAVKFYPYERREAAAVLRNRGATAEAAASATATTQQGGAADAFAKVKAKAEEKTAAGDLDGALALLDQVSKDCKEHAPYQAMRGELNFKMAVKTRDEGRRGVEFFFQDAVTALTKAVELDSAPIAPRLLLAQSQYEASDLAGAAKTASSLLLHMQSLGGGKPAEVTATHLVRANAAARAYSAQKAEGKDDADLLAAVRTSFRLLEQQNLLDQPLLELWSNTEQWATAPAEAVNVFARALAKSPDDQVLLGKLVDTAAAQDQLTLATDVLQKRKDATGLWYLGKAIYLRAGIEREGQKNAEALKSLDASRQAFADSMASNAAYKQSCERWIAMCLGKKGNIAFWSDDLPNAEKWLLEGTKLCPEGITDDLGLAETTKLGLLRVADKHFQKKDLAKVEAIYRTASDAANGDPDLLNNAGLFARDHGNALEAAGKKAAAMEMYEQSYKAYGRAHQLDPSNVRLRNDCALIAIYHLERDWELTKKLLDAAIQEGDKALKDNPPENADEKRALEEAVGDCYENLALWHLKHSNDGAAAKAAAVKSQDYYPGQRRGGARRHIAAAERLLQGK